MKMVLRKLFCLLLMVVLCLSALNGCSSSRPYGTSDNEILTYRKLNPDKTHLLISRTGNLYIDELCTDFEAANPDIEIIVLDITGGVRECRPYVDQVEKGPAPDIMFLAAGLINNYAIQRYFVNLSGNPVLTKYQTEALSQVSQDGSIYQLPGPSNAEAMLYNKTLFRQYGWEIPKSVDDFISLCNKITADTSGEITPWNPNAKYSDELIKVFQGMCYGKLFAGIDNRTWYNEFLDGKASYYDHMKPMYDMIQQMIDNNLINEEFLTYSATTRWNEFIAGKTAMVNVPISKIPNSTEYEFGIIPFPALDNEDTYIIESISCSVCVVKKERTDKEEDAVQRFIEYFSTPKAQEIYINNSRMISNIKDVPISTNSGLDGIQDVIDSGHKFRLIDFYSNGNKLFNFNVYNQTVQAVKGELSLLDSLQSIDDKPFIEAAEKEIIKPDVVATAAEDLNILDTSFYFADMYKEKTGADIALIANNSAYRGNLMRIYKGDINTDIVTVLKPRSFANDSTLIKVKMKGSNLLEALDNPPNDDNGGVADCIYAYSGLKCSVAPWKPQGERMISVKLADGSAIEPDTDYTVACWSGTVADNYVSEILETYEGSYEELLTEKLKKDKTISPARDGRIKLLWD